MRKMDELKYKLCKELDEYAEKQKMSAGDLEIIHKLSDTIKNLAKIEMLDDEGDGGYSNARGRGRNAKRDSMGRYSRDGGYRQDGYSYPMNDGGYYRGGRGGYSRDSAKERMIEQIEEMMDDVESPKEREALQRCLRSLETA